MNKKILSLLYCSVITMFLRAVPLDYAPLLQELLIIQKHTPATKYIAALCAALSDDEMLSTDIIEPAFDQAVAYLQEQSANLPAQEVERIAHILETAYDALQAKQQASSDMAKKSLYSHPTFQRVTTGSAQVTGNVTIGQNITIGGNETIGGYLEVGGTTVINGDTIFNGNVIISGTTVVPFTGSAQGSFTLIGAPEQACLIFDNAAGAEKARICSNPTVGQDGLFISVNGGATQNLQVNNAGGVVIAEPSLGTTLTVNSGGTFAAPPLQLSGIPAAFGGNDVLQIDPATGIVTQGLISTGSYISTLMGNTGSAMGSVVNVVGGNNVGITGNNASTLTVSVTGATQNAVQIGAANGALASVPVGTTNTVLLGNTGAAPTFGTVPNAATTATSTNTANAIVARDGSGNFSAGTITATLAGNATTATTVPSATTATTTTNFTGALAGDVTGTQGATAVALVGGQSAANVAAGTALANAATNANTPNTLVKRDGSGNFSAGTVTANLAGNATSATTATTAGTVVTTTNFTGALAGDVTGTQGATTVALVGGQSAANVAAGTVLANGATSTNTPNTIVKRDGSGNFAAGTITVNGITTPFANGVVVSSAGILTSTAGTTAGQFLTSNGAGTVPTFQSIGSEIIILSADSGSASGSRVSIHGGSNISTIATGTYVTINLVNSPSVSGSLTAGIGITATTGNIVATAGNITAATGAVSANTTVTAGTDLYAALGTAAAPSHSFTASTNTGMYAPAAGQVALSTSGAKRLGIDANGAITVIAPTAGANPALTVNGGTGATGEQIIAGTGQTGLGVTGVASFPAIIPIGNSASAASTPLQLQGLFSGSSSNILAVDGSGNVINTSIATPTFVTLSSITSGSYTVTIPSNAIDPMITLVAGGGGGGGGNISGPFSGGGGAGGSILVNNPLTPGVQYTITVGAGGTGGTGGSGGPATNGGNSTIVPTAGGTTLTTNGGNFGTQANPGAGGAATAAGNSANGGTAYAGAAGGNANTPNGGNGSTSLATYPGYAGGNGGSANLTEGGGGGGGGYNGTGGLGGRGYQNTVSPALGGTIGAGSGAGGGGAGQPSGTQTTLTGGNGRSGSYTITYSLAG